MSSLEVQGNLILAKQEHCYSTTPADTHKWRNATDNPRASPNILGLYILYTYFVQ